MGKNIKRIIKIFILGTLIGSSIFAMGCENKENRESKLINDDVSFTEEIDEVIGYSENNKDINFAENQVVNESIATNTEKRDNEYMNKFLEIVDENVTITPYNVYYDNGKLVVHAYVYNGFDYEIYNINNVSISLENAETKIAEATFNGLEQVRLAPKSFIQWTFTFYEDVVFSDNANLNELYWQNSCSYSHQAYYLVSK